MENTELFEHLRNEGYFNIKEIPGQGICALYRMAFTIGLLCHCDETGYSGRYCFKHIYEAIEAINTWNGENDPPGNWIKHKGGEKGEYSNPNYEE